MVLHDVFSTFPHTWIFRSEKDSYISSPNTDSKEHKSQSHKDNHREPELLKNIM